MIRFRTETPHHSDGCARRVLILVHAVPPVPRILKFARHLQTFGWTPTLLAPRRPDRGDRRFAHDDVLSQVAVEQTFLLPALENVVRRLLGRLRRRSPEPPSHDAPPVARSLGPWSVPRQLLLWTSTPDEYVGWLPWALWRGWRLVREKQIDAILASGPPFSVVLAGALLGRLTRRPFVADFRDAWVRDPVDPFGCLTGSFRAVPSRRRRAVLEFLERHCLARAASVLFTSDYTLSSYSNAYPEISARSTVLYNGVEEPDFGGSPEPAPSFAFTYVGTLHEYQREQFALFVRAFGLALRQEPGMSACQVRVCGHRPAYVDAEIERVAREVMIADNLVREAAVPHRRAMALLKGTSVLLLFAGTSLFVRPSKLSEYLATDRPILALAPAGSEAATHVERFGHALYAGNSPDELAALIVRLWTAHRAGRPIEGTFPFPYPHPLNWKSSSAALASTLDRLYASSGESLRHAGQ